MIIYSVTLLMVHVLAFGRLSRYGNTESCGTILLCGRTLTKAFPKEISERADLDREGLFPWSDVRRPSSSVSASEVNEPSLLLISWEMDLGSLELAGKAGGGVA